MSKRKKIIEVEIDYSKIVHEAIEEILSSPVDLGDGASHKFNYLNGHMDSYIRTVRDIDNLYKEDKDRRKILEIGSFFGPVSISLKKIGYTVCAIDIPEFYKFPSLRSLYERNGIDFKGVNLRQYKLPYESSSIDAVIICEVIEHLNFNPLPVLNEINRILKRDGYIYIGMPNQSSVGKRMKMLVGKSINEPIDRFFEQLNGMSTQIIGLHWREYTLIETVQLIKKMGFEPITKYYFVEKQGEKSIFLAALKKGVYLYPPFRPYQVVIGKKVASPTYEFYLTEANS